jgi:hypothetical protein
MKYTAFTKIIELIAALFILLFVYTAASKFLAQTLFLYTLKGLPLIGFAAAYLAWIIPALEVLAAILLFFPTTRRLGFMLALALMSAFTIYVGYMITTSTHLPCSCGGIIASLSWKQHLWLNVFLTAVATVPFITTRHKFLLQ